MRIGQSFVPVGIGPRRGIERQTGDAGFAGRIGGRPADRAGGATGLAPLTSLGAVLALQAVDDPLAGRRRARRRGAELLDALDELRLALLDGTLSADRLNALKRLAAERCEAVDDPALAAVLEEIELRSAVELAKLERRA